MTNPPFLLLPWDKKLKKGAVRHADAVAQWNGKTYLLRAENGHLFFREADDDTRLWAVSVSLPDGSDVSQWPQFWLEGMESGEVARYLCYEFQGAFERDFPIFLRADGTGFCREYWNREDIEISHSVSRHDWLEGSTSVLLQSVREFFWDNIAERIEQLDFPDETNFSDADEKIEWLCGSRDELQRVVEWICWLEPEFWEEDVAQAELDFETEGILSRAKLSLFEAGEKVGNYPLNYEAGKGLTESEWGYDYQSERTKKWAPSEAFLPLIELALDYNTPAGEYWEYHDCCSGRASCSPSPIYLEIVVARPSAHEKIEAALQLEKWLQNKVSSREIEQLLRR